MSVLTLVVILTLPVIVLWWESAKLTPLVVISASLTAVLFGYAELDRASGTTNIALLYCLAVACLVGGHIAHGAWGRARSCVPRGKGVVLLPKRSSSPIVTFAIIVVFLTVYHFAASGIPLLSENVEVARFDFTSSGLLGIPGRMFLFGLPFAVLFISIAAFRMLEPVSRGLVYFVWLAYITASLLGGFKGGLLAVVTLMLLTRSVAGRPVSVRRAVLGWPVLLIASALLYCAVISFRYKSLGLANPEDVIPYLSARATITAATPGYLVFSRYGFDGSGGYHYVHDASYFLRKYAWIFFEEASSVLPFDRAVSAVLYQTPTSGGSFIVPVTVGAFPELVANLGVFLALPGMFVIGYLISYFTLLAQTCVDAFRSGLFALGVHLLQTYVLNGNLVYTCLNFALVGLFLFGLYSFCRVAASRVGGR